MAKIAILGYGVVGSGVAEVLIKNAKSISRKAGEDIEVKYVLDLRKFEDTWLNERLVNDFDIIANDDEVEVVVECLGGDKPAYDFVKTSLLRGKSVATSNKEMVANHGAELLQIAKENNCNLFFEASVGGGIPIIRPLHQCLAANEIKEIAGIVNGTTNFILTKMISENMSFDKALELAQDLGYAERVDPSADVDGHDSCRKICILASLAFGIHVYPSSVKTGGISALDISDLKTAQLLGYEVKLIARAQILEDGKILSVVSSAFVPKDSLLADINDVFNGIMVRGDVLGDVLFYGKGAGKLPTASAVVADVIDAVQNRGTNKGICWKESDESKMASGDSEEISYYVRVSSEDKNSLRDTILKIFPKASRVMDSEKDVVFITDIAATKDLDNKLSKFSESDIKVVAAIPVLNY